jgi:hypothetical protein
MQIIHVDLITDMPKTVMGNTIISVCVCAMTGWLTIHAHASKDAETIAKHLTEEFFYKYGYPEVMKTDNGGEFRNGTMRALQHLLHIRSSLTTPYNSQANGKVEKRNSTIYDILSTFCSSQEENQRRWDEFLPVVAWSYNTTVNNATGFTPFRSMFGREARLPQDSWIEDFASTFNIDIHDYVTRTTDTLRHIWDKIAIRSIENHERIVAQYEAKRKRAFAPYRIGEQFYYKMMPRRNFLCADDERKYKLSGKLQYRYTGPHMILTVINPVTYTASFDGFKRTVHANRMKRDSRRNLNRRDIRHSQEKPSRSPRTSKPPDGVAPQKNEDPEDFPTAQSQLFVNMASSTVAKITETYGIYSEEWNANYHPKTNAGRMSWGRTSLQPNIVKLPMIPTMTAIPQNPLSRKTLPRPQPIDRTGNSWAHTRQGQPERVDLIDIGCLWDASGPDNGPFNGQFHQHNQTCRRCSSRTG